MPVYHLATFSADVTPPPGHPLCGGWIEPVRGVDDPLEIVGVVLLGFGAPVVLAAIDWTGLRNEAYHIWRAAIAEAAHTVPENVALQCVHPHNAPFADTEAQVLMNAIPGGPPLLDLNFFAKVVKNSASAVKSSLKSAQRITHIGIGQAKIKEVASNRRIIGNDGKVRFTRTSATRDPAVRAEPEGLIDPWLKTLSFWDEQTPRAALHYYATHPMSYYGDGRVSADFCGLARRKRQAEDPTIKQIYFTGCAGNITAGKYNDGSKENRPILRDRIHAGMVEAWKTTQRSPISQPTWRVRSVKLQPRPEASFGEVESRKAMEDPRATTARRCNGALQRAWLIRKDKPIELTALHLGSAIVLNLPGEPFIEYQFKGQAMRPDLSVCIAGYGDGGPGYLPTQEAFGQGGYELTVALAGASSESILLEAMSDLLKK